MFRNWVLEIRYLNVMTHVPVLLDEVISYLKIKPGGVYIDATLGFGGHAQKILEIIGPKGIMLGVDIDQEAIDEAEKKLSRIGKNFRIFCDNFINIKNLVYQQNIRCVDGILFDLGTNIHQIKSGARGFSFLVDGPLDMRLGRKPVQKNTQFRIKELTAAEILNKWSEEKLADIFWDSGEIKARKIARAIVLRRREKKFERTGELVGLIKKIKRGYTKIHPATKVFQALRIAVNDEIKNLKIALSDSLDLLAPRGRLVVISFHSGEDRVVKNFFKEQKDLKILTKKPVTPSEEEIIKNPHSRSARLRAAEKIAD